MSRWARLTGLPPGPGRQLDDFVKHCRCDVRALLAHPGCPVCGLLPDAARNLFFWFLEERYYLAETLERLTASYGFCPVHTAGLVRSRASYRIAVLHSLLFARIILRLGELLELAREAGPPRRLLERLHRLQPSRACLACEELARAADWAVRSLARCLALPDLLEAYLAHPHGLCVVHFQAVARLAPRPVLEPLCRRQSELLSALQGDLDRFLQRGVDPGGGWASPPDDLAKAVAGVVEATVGLDPMAPERGFRTLTGAPPTDDADRRPGSHDAVGTLAGLLGHQACPVCVLRDRALGTYLGWLDREGRTRLAGRGTLDHPDPYCPPHTRAVLAVVHPPVAAHLAAARLAGDLGQLQDGAARLAGRAPRPDLASPTLRDRIEELLPELRRRRFLGEAREILTRPAGCALCGHLAETERRTLELLFALLQDPGPRQAFAGGRGLCVPHFLQGLSLAVPRGVLRVLVEHRLARLSVLRWEVDELVRKASWHLRHEPKGAEQSAWHRAAEHLAGRLPDR